LKHLILGLPYAMKIQCLDELGVGWLVQVLNGEPSKPAMGTPNAAGEQVDLLNAFDEPHMDVDEDPSEEDDNEDTMADISTSILRHQRPGFRYTSATSLRDRLQQIRNDEQDSRLTGERDDVRIQEQALDFIRNFISDHQCAGDMIDHILKAFGHSRFFDILDAKLRPKNTSTPAPSSQQNATTPTYWPYGTQRATASPSATQQQTNWSTYPATELIHASIMILVHIANGKPTHRSLLISQTSLMQHVHPLLTHPNNKIRSACGWVLHNLLWVDDSNDDAPARDRAVLLKHMGFEEGAKILTRDTEQDIHQRAKMTVDAFAKLLNEGAPHLRNFEAGRLGGLHGWRHDSRG
jgi:hypothetical protein